MKEGKQYTFWQLISSDGENKAILIPQIQRDYIQYRTGKVEKNLSRFVSNLISSITTDNKSINLNFIYGNTTKIYETNYSIDAFIPIDGQQRLTTLFLLHYYIFNEANSTYRSGLNQHFFYKTRSTTQKFLETLIAHNKSFYNQELTPSNIIKNAGWYSSLWNFDPSVQSCLKVLDQINDTFKNLNTVPDWKHLSQLLTRAENCPITFMLLEIEGIDKPNELYIKMNSRGKQLTAFENFKTELYGYIKKLHNFPSPSFKEGIDGDWLNIIWNWCKELTEDVCEKYTDVLYRELLHWIIINRISCFKNEDDISDSFRFLLNEDPEKIYLTDYKSQVTDEEFKLCLYDIYNTMSLFSSLDEEFKRKISYEVLKLRYEKNVFSSNLSQHTQRTLLFAITSYASKCMKKGSLDIPKFSSWWRVAKNLITNSQIDSLGTYLSAINALDNFQHTTDIVSYLCQLDESPECIKFIDLPALNISQCREEILKQKIIVSPSVPGWKEAIFLAEEHIYFSGEIFFALKLSNVTVSLDATLNTLTKFKENWEKIKEIFTEPRDDNGIHRLLLIYGDYSKEMSWYADDNYFWSYYFNDKNHNQDWRGLLRDDKNLNLFQNMFNEFKSSNQSFSEFVQQKCDTINTATQINCEASKQDLHYYLIKVPELFDHIYSYGRCWHHKGQIYLLRTSTRATFINYKLFVVFSKLKDSTKKLHEGKGNDQDFISVGGKNYYYDANGFYTYSNGQKLFLAKTIEDMISAINPIILS